MQFLRIAKPSGGIVWNDSVGFRGCLSCQCSVVVDVFVVHLGKLQTRLQKSNALRGVFHTTPHSTEKGDKRNLHEAIKTAISEGLEHG